MLDADKSGKLGFEEFEALLSDIAKWKAIFKTYDTENSGRISGFQLREALNSAGYHLNNRVLNALGHRYGSRDGKIAFDDFLMCAVKIKTYIGNSKYIIYINMNCKFFSNIFNIFSFQKYSKKETRKRTKLQRLRWRNGLNRQFTHKKSIGSSIQK